MESESCHGIFFGFAGMAISMIFAAFGTVYGIVKTAPSVAGTGVSKPNLVMKSLVPVIMCGILEIYGLTISVLISLGLSPDGTYSLFRGSMDWLAGCFVAGGCISSGYTLGTIGHKGVVSYSKNQSLFMGMIIMCIFAEAFGLYGFIMAMVAGFAKP